jgi:hypothetical protein
MENLPHLFYCTTAAGRIFLRSLQQACQTAVCYLSGSSPLLASALGHTSHLPVNTSQSDQIAPQDAPQRSVGCHRMNSIERYSLLIPIHDTYQTARGGKMSGLFECCGEPAPTHTKICTATIHHQYHMRHRHLNIHKLQHHPPVWKLKVLSRWHPPPYASAAAAVNTNRLSSHSFPTHFTPPGCRMSGRSLAPATAGRASPRGHAARHTPLDAQHTAHHLQHAKPCCGPASNAACAAVGLVPSTASSPQLLFRLKLPPPWPLPPLPLDDRR